MSIKKSGMISIVGRPNVGKSTLTNALVGEKVAIVSNKPQTTRNRICAILNRGESQFVFLDTPGLHKARTRLGDYMVNVVKESVADVDAVMLLVEPIPNVGGPEAELIARIKTLGCPSVLVINKVDTLEHKEELLEVIQTYGQAHEFTAVVPVSARTGEGGAMLKKVSSLARQDMERFMGTKVYLQTWVKVKENWRDNVNLIRNFGYRDE